MGVELEDGQALERFLGRPDGGRREPVLPTQEDRELAVVEDLPSTFLEAFVTLTLIEGSRSEIMDVRFEPGERRAKPVSLRSLSPEPPPVRVDTLVIRSDGSTFLGQPFETSEPVILVRDRDGDFRQVGVRLLAGASLAAHGLMAVQVQLLDEHGEQLDNVVFSESQRGPGMLLVPTDQEGGASSYRVIRYALDGKAEESPLQPVTMVPELLIPAVAAVV